MIINDLIRKQDLVNNPTTRVPVCLCLDVSGSMSGDPIDELNKGVRLFYDAVKNDEVALYAVEICIVTFGGVDASCRADFASLELQPYPPRFSADGMTPMGEAVNLALDKLEKRINEYKNAGVKYYQPWLVLITDGGPNGDASELTRAKQRTVDLVNSKKLTVFPIGISPEADMNTLATFSPRRTPMWLQGMRFREFFLWLSMNVVTTSRSNPFEKIKLESVDGWGTL